VTVGAGAIVLGPILLGDGSRIGAGSVVLHDVAPGSVAVGVPARATTGTAGKDHVLDHAGLPDPVAQAIRLVLADSAELRGRVLNLERLEGAVSDLDRRLEQRRAEVEVVFASTSGDEFVEGSGI
jgi:serine O-acetyltransferase